jgi:hypothetical protein
VALRQGSVPLLVGSMPLETYTSAARKIFADIILIGKGCLKRFNSGDWNKVIVHGVTYLERLWRKPSEQ